MPEPDRRYRRGARAWCLYDAGRAAFATTALAVVLPAYYRQVAGSTLPGPGTAAALWAAGLSISLAVSALLAPLLGVLSDLLQAKKRLFAVSAGLGAACTALLVLVDRGGWLAASLLFVFAQVGFAASALLHGALLPHAARPEDQDRVSAGGRALGFLAGGVLLAANLALLRWVPGTWGPRLCFAAAAFGWALFSVPMLVLVPEPAAFTARPAGPRLLEAALRRLDRTLRNARRYREPLSCLLACLLGTIGIVSLLLAAAARGRQLGLGIWELTLVLLLVQLAEVPYSRIFGILPRPQGESASSREARLRPVLLAFLLANLVLLPALGAAGVRMLPKSWTGAAPAPYAAVGGHVGQGDYAAGDPALVYLGAWASEADGTQAGNARSGQRAGDRVELRFHGQGLALSFAAGPNFGLWHVEMDGRPLAGEDGRPLLLNCYSREPRRQVTREIQAASAGLHTLALSNNGEKDTRSSGTRLALGAVRVLGPQRRFRLPRILGMLLALQAVCLGLSFLAGPLLSGPAGRLGTRGGLMLALGMCAEAALCGWLLDSVLGFACLAWLGAGALGGSLALGRSLFAGLVPASRSGEFFGLWGAAESLAALAGLLVYGACARLGFSRMAILAPAVLLAAGIALLARVHVEQGRRAARAEDRRRKAAPA